jgi:hypothetical protein
VVTPRQRELPPRAAGAEALSTPVATLRQPEPPPRAAGAEALSTPVATPLQPDVHAGLSLL